MKVTGISGPAVHSALSEDAADSILHVHWSLVRSCNYSCHFCSAAFKTEENCVFLPERIQAIIARILAWPCAGLNIALAGGEAALHPWLPEIIQQLFQASRPVYITLASNGSFPLQFYLSIAAKAPSHSLRLALSIPPQYADMPRLLMLISMFAERGQHVWARLAHDPANVNMLERCAMGLARLRETVAFDLDVMDFRAGCGLYCQLAKGPQAHRARALFAAAVAKSGRETPVSPFAHAEAKPGEKGRAVKAGAGVNVLRIQPDGSYYLSLDDDVPRMAPLWEGADIMHKSSCGVGASPDGSCGASDALGQHLRRRLNFLREAGEDAPCHAEPELLAHRGADIRKLHDLLADEQSREVFLRNVKALAHGNVKWLSASPYPLRQHPHVQINAENAAYAGGFAYCASLELTAASPWSFADVQGVIGEHKPKLLLQAQRNVESLLDMPLRLLQAQPAYVLYMGQHGGEAWFYARAALAEPRRYAPLQAGPAITVIVTCKDNVATLGRALDSLLLQNVGDLQVIIVDDASADGSVEAADAYCRLYPQIFSLARMPKSCGAGACRNAGLERALGLHVAFLSGADMLEPGALAAALAEAERSGGEIVEFDRRRVESAVPLDDASQARAHGVDQTVAAMSAPLKTAANTARADASGAEADANTAWPGASAAGAEVEAKSTCAAANETNMEETFAAFSRAGANLGCQGRLYSRQLLARHNIYFGPGDFWGTLSFNIRAFYHAVKIIAIAGAGWHSGGEREAPDVAYFQSFAAFAEFMADFCANHGLDANGAQVAHALRFFYEAERSRLFQAVSRCGEILAIGEDLRKIGRLRQLLQLILADSANLYCRKTGKKLSPARTGEMVALSPQAQCVPYGDADAPGPRPRLSVIMPNYNKLPYLPACLASILSQSFADYELIIIDDASTDGSFELLASYACHYPHIRLYRMSANCRQGICRNFGIEAARGEYVIFTDSDDLCMPGYFERALEAMAGTQAEMTFFSTQELDAEGNVAWTDEFEDANLSKTYLLDAFFQGQFQSAPWGKVFRREAIGKRRARFAEYVYHQDGPFLYAMLGGAGDVQTRRFVAVRRVHSADSAMRPEHASLLALHSAYVYYIFIERAVAEFLRRGVIHRTRLDYIRQIEWNMENVLLPQARALAGTCELIDADVYPDLARSSLFIWSLLKIRGALEPVEEACPSGKAGAEERQGSAEAAPLAAVIIDAELAGADIRRCLASVFQQSLPNIEIFIVAARPDAVEELELIAGAVNARVLLLAGEAGARRNQALEFCGAPYVAFVDDFLPADFLLHGIARLERDRGADFIAMEQGLEPELRRVEGGELLRRYAEGVGDGLRGKIFRKSSIEAIPFAAHAFGDALFLLNFYVVPATGLLETVAGRAARELAVLPAQTARKPAFGYSQLRSFFAVCADVSAFFRGAPGQLAQKRIAAGYAAIRRQLFSYCAGLPAGATSPFGSALLRDLRRAPELFRILLEDLAGLYAETEGWSWQGATQAAREALPVEAVVDAVLYAEAPAQANIALSLILPCGDDPDALRFTLASLAEAMPAAAELMLIETCSQNSEIFELARASVAKNPQIRFFRASAPLAYGPCANLAIAQASGSHVLFLESGCEVARDFLVNAANFCHHDVDLVLFAAGNSILPDSLCQPASKSGAFLAMLAGEQIFAGRCLLRKSFLQSLDIHFGNHVYCAAIFVLRALLSCATFASHACTAATPPVKKPNAAAPARELFLAQLARLRELAAISPSLQGQEAPRALATWLLRRENGFLADFCRHVNACAESGAPEPLTEEALETLAFSDDFLQLLLMRLARMGHAASGGAHA